MDEKPFKTIDEMSSLLVQRRGLVCSSIDELKNFLERVNYYRFSGYAREFQHAPKYGDNNFMDGVSFQQIVNLMEMDSKLRHLLLEQLGIIEIAIRAKIAYEYGHDYGNTAYYLDIDNYNEGNNPSVDRPFSIVQGILSDLERDKSRMLGRYADSSIISNDFDSKCKRYRNVPIWVAVEVLSFGQRGTLVEKVNDKEWVVQMGIIKMKIAVEDLSPIAEAQEAKQQVIVKSARASHVSSELDLRGKRYEEAMKDLELYLDAAILANYPRVTIIHGRGTGAIQQGVHKVLRSHRSVASFEFAPMNTGGNGATIVTFK